MHPSCPPGCRRGSLAFSSLFDRVYAHTEYFRNLRHIPIVPTQRATCPVLWGCYVHSNRVLLHHMAIQGSIFDPFGTPVWGAGVSRRPLLDTLPSLWSVAFAHHSAAKWVFLKIQLYGNMAKLKTHIPLQRGL